VPFAVAAQDTVSVSIVGITNPTSPATETTATLKTSGDVIATSVQSYSIVAASTTPASVTVSVTPTSPGVPATYTIGNFVAGSSGLTGGSGTISITAPANTIFPNVPSDYTITDATHSSGSGTVTAAVTGAPGNAITLTVPNTITAGDKLSITATDVSNPASGSYTLSVTSANITAVSLTNFPVGSSSYPNGAIVNYNGFIVVFAGGRAFGAASPQQLQMVQNVDHATVLTAPAGAVAPTANALRVGTLVVVAGQAEIWVMGTDGALHGFASPTQLLQDGYDGADVITVPNLNGLTQSTTTVGAQGTAGNALATSSDGAIVNSSGTFYVFAGGHAQGIATPTQLAAVEAAEPWTTPLSGSVSSAAMTQSIASGVVVTINGGVYVSFGGSLYAFKSYSQLLADGYGGTPSIYLPNSGGLTIVTAYAGS
jgi:hypothetical protein